MPLYTRLQSYRQLIIVLFLTKNDQEYLILLHCYTTEKISSIFLSSRCCYLSTLYLNVCGHFWKRYTSAENQNYFCSDRILKIVESLLLRVIEHINKLTTAVVLKLIVATSAYLKTKRNTFKLTVFRNQPYSKYFSKAHLTPSETCLANLETFKVLLFYLSKYSCSEISLQNEFTFKISKKYVCFFKLT